MSIRHTLRALRRSAMPIRLANSAGDADAFLVSYPKSGRTWLRFLLSSYFAQALALDLEVTLHSMFRVIPNFDFDRLRGLPAFSFADRRPALPLILVSHRDYSRFVFRARRAIVMVRDPRDVMVSAYFHATRHKQRFDGPIDAFLRDPEQGLPALVRYLNGWSQAAQHNPCHVLSYEQLSGDPQRVVGDLLRFLEVDVDEGALAAAIERAQFDRMRAREQREGLPAHEYDRADDESLRMRRGKSGGYTEYLSAADSAAIIEHCRRTLLPGARAMLATTGVGLD